MSTVDAVIHLVFLACASAFVLGLHMMNSPATARRGNLLSAAGMAVAIAMTVVVAIREGGFGSDGGVATINLVAVAVAVAGVLSGSLVGLVSARRVQMTAMPQLVSLFNAVGGGAAALVAVGDLVGENVDDATTVVLVAAALDVAIGLITFTGSLIATGKLQGVVSGSPVIFPGSRVLAGISVVVMLAGSVALIGGWGGFGALAAIAVAALVFGVIAVLPIGGADMPVVISLLNACTGTAVAMAGFVLDSAVLIIAGALVGASGSILTVLMAKAMNRSVISVIIGGFGTGDGAVVAGAGAGGAAGVRESSADDVAIQLAYANKVIIVPGYGLAAAQAQHELVALADLLQTRGVDVSYAIHPVAGRMPGHMNVLLAEANVPYPQMKEMDEVNPDFAQADVALVVGANDVTNPAARRPGSAITGMPILDVDHARSVVVIKRSMGHGYAGIGNELYTDPKTGMFFADAKKGLAQLASAVKTLVGS